MVLGTCVARGFDSRRRRLYRDTKRASGRETVANGSQTKQIYRRRVLTGRNVKLRPVYGHSVSAGFRIVVDIKFKNPKIKIKITAQTRLLLCSSKTLKQFVHNKGNNKLHLSLSLSRMGGRWRFDRVMLRLAAMVVVSLLHLQNLSVCWCLNNEGLALLRFRDRVVRDPFNALSNWHDNDGDNNPCSWFGVECSDGKVVILNLKDLCLEGMLAPELSDLSYLKSIVLHNNSFYGNIPKEIGELKELEVLDLGYNNFSGPFPSELASSLALAILLLDDNQFLDNISPELYELKKLSEFQVDEKQPFNTALGATCNRKPNPQNGNPPGSIAERRLLQVVDAPNLSRARSKNNERISETSLSPSQSQFPSSVSPSGSPFSTISFPPSMSPSSPESPFASPSESPRGNILTPSLSPVLSLSPLSSTPANLPSIDSASPPLHSAPVPFPTSTPSQNEDKSSKSKHHTVLILSSAVGVSVFIFASAVGFLLCRSTKVVTVKPWATGLSGQLQKAFVTGVPKLKQSELETACEDFSNIIGSVSDGTVYKGTLSSGVEIAVTSIAVVCREDWSKNLESQFRKKIGTLSKVNHKNFVNLIGYCEEEEPFTRMMVFEYAPNGTLFEHLHVKEAEHLDWAMRLRIAMGMAYCLEYMHQLTPPLVHRNLQSSSVYLTEDYAAKISDFSFQKEITAAEKGSAATELLESSSVDPESNVYSFGLILIEMLTGKLPFLEDNASLAKWASNYLKGGQPPREMVDPTLKSFKEDELKKLFKVIKVCVHPDPKQRPMMKEVTAMLKEITEMGPDGATPKLSPLWWAELEIMSTEAS